MRFDTVSTGSQYDAPASRSVESGCGTFFEATEKSGSTALNTVNPDPILTNDLADIVGAGWTHPGADDKAPAYNVFLEARGVLTSTMSEAVSLTLKSEIHCNNIVDTVHVLPEIEVKIPKVT